jgi:hypothetical protein
MAEIIGNAASMHASMLALFKSHLLAAIVHQAVEQFQLE